MPRIIFDNGRIQLVAEDETTLNIKTGQLSQLPPRPFNRTSTIPVAPQKPIQPPIPEETPEQKDQNLRKTAIQDEIKSLQSQGKKPEHIRGAMGLIMDEILGSIIPSKTYEIKPDQSQEIDEKPISVRGLEAKPKELNLLKAILFSEISNRKPEKRELESRVIANTALNRMAEVGKTLEQVLTQRNAYQGIKNKEFRKVMKGELNELDKEKMAVVEKIIEEIMSGNFEDNTEGSVFYIHNPDGSITYRSGKLGGFKEEYENLDELLK